MNDTRSTKNSEHTSKSFGLRVGSRLSRFCVVKYLFALIILPSPAAAQVFEGTLLLDTQEKVDQFDYTEVDGWLNIRSEGVTHLDSLYRLATVTGSLSIEGTGLRDLRGLDGLVRAGGILISVNPRLNSTFGLDSLRVIEYQFNIRENPSLVSITAASLDTLGSLYIADNDSLTELAGLSNLSFANGDVSVTANARLKTLGGLTGLRQIEASLFVASNDSLESITGLEHLEYVREGLNIFENPMLKSLNGLNGLRRVVQSLRILSNAALESVDGLSNLEAVGPSGNWYNLEISNNPSLIELDGLAALRTADLVSITRNERLIDVDGLASLSDWERLELFQNPQLTECNCGLYDLINGRSFTQSVQLESNGDGCSSTYEILALGACEVGKADDVHILGPSDNVVISDTVVRVAWDSLDAIRRYHLVIGLDPDFHLVIVDDRMVQGTEFLFEPNPAFERYYWKLRSRGRAEWGPWSETRSFTVDSTAGPGQLRPSLVSPASGAADQPTRLRLVWQEVPFAVSYDVEISSGGEVVSLSNLEVGEDVEVEVDGLVRFLTTLEKGSEYSWRVRGYFESGSLPWSTRWTFVVSNQEVVVPGPLDIDGSETWAFVQIQGIGDNDACGSLATSTYGCSEVGGNWVYGSYNGQQNWIMYHSGAGPEESIGLFAPNDFEIRVTETGSYGYYGFPFGGGEPSGNVVRVPFEIWDIGPTGPFGANDPNDDVQMIPLLYANSGGECSFGFGEGDDPFGLGWQITDRIYAYYPKAGHTHASWASSVAPLVEADPQGCPSSPTTDPASEAIDSERGRPLQRIIFMMDPNAPQYRPEMIPVGNVIRFYTTKETGGAPSPSSPGNQTTVSGSSVRLWWNPLDDNFATEVQVSSTNDFSILLVDTALVADSFVATGLESGTHYYWRVKHANSIWSATWEFDVVANTSTESIGTELPDALEIRSIYPNPVVDVVTIQYGLPKADAIEVDLFDVLGRKVLSILKREDRPGWHEVRWSATNLAPGVYFVRLESRGGQRVKTMVVL